MKGRKKGEISAMADGGWGIMSWKLSDVRAVRQGYQVTGEGIAHKIRNLPTDYIKNNALHLMNYFLCDAN